VRRRDLGDQGEPEPVAAPPLLEVGHAGGEAVEQAGPELRVDARPVVGHGDHRLVAVPVRRHRDGAVRVP